MIDLATAIERRDAMEPPHPILAALDALALALAEHGHAWSERERQLYETAVSYLFGGCTGSD